MKSFYLLFCYVLLATSCCYGFQFPEDGPACIIVNMDTTIMLRQLGNNPAFIPVDAFTSLDNATVFSSYCATGNLSTSNMMLETTEKSPMIIFLKFNKDESIVFMKISVSFKPDNIFMNNDTKTILTTDKGYTRLSSDTTSYVCPQEQHLLFSMQNSTKFTYEINMTISNVVIQAFNIVNGTLSEAEECNAEVTSVEPDNNGTSTIPETNGTSTIPETNVTTTTGNTTFTTDHTQGFTTMEVTSAAPENTTTFTTDHTQGFTTMEVTSAAPENTTTFTTDHTQGFTTMEVTSAAPATPRPDSPPVNSYNVKGENGTCIMLQGGIQFQIPYNNTHKQLATKTIGIPNRVTLNGSCTQPNSTQDVDIAFYDGWDLRITFSKMTSSDETVHVYLSEIQLSANLTNELFPDIETPIYREDMVKMFGTDTIKASADGSYKCIKETSFALQDGFVMNTYNLQYAAFQTNITSFSDSDLTECSADVVNHSYIPIIVGASLGGLIIVVLIAYIIGRRCESKGGYDTI